MHTGSELQENRWHGLNLSRTSENQISDGHPTTGPEELDKSLSNYQDVVVHDRALGWLLQVRQQRK